jgi:hypothetical protein
LDAIELSGVIATNAHSVEYAANEDKQPAKYSYRLQCDEFLRANITVRAERPLPIRYSG